MSCSSPTRLPRSLHESPAFDPAWRHSQTEEYLRFRRHLGAQAGTFILPTSERDSMVRAYFKFRSGVVGPKHAAFRYAQDCDDSNDRTFVGSRIKAMTVAGLTAVEIAKRLHTGVENIDAFRKLFFDVGEYVGDREAMGALLAPMIEQSTAANARERVWLLAALKLGPKGLDYVMDQRVKLSPTEQKEISDSIHSILAEQTLAYTLRLQSQPEPGAEILGYFQKSLELRARHPAPEDDGKWAVYSDAVVQAAKRKFGL
jgi:hypothetical protein